MTLDEVKAEIRIVLMRNARQLDEHSGIPGDDLLETLADIAARYAASRVVSAPNRRNVTKITEKVSVGASE
jgi:hypothetical protein